MPGRVVDEDELLGAVLLQVRCRELGQRRIIELLRSLTAEAELFGDVNERPPLPAQFEDAGTLEHAVLGASGAWHRYVSWDYSQVRSSVTAYSLGLCWSQRNSATVTTGSRFWM